MSPLLARSFAMGLLGLIGLGVGACREVTIDDPNDEATELAPLQGTAFLNWFHGQTTMKLTEVTASGKVGPAARSIACVSGLDKGPSGEYVLADAQLDTIQSKTPTRATCRLTVPGTLPTEYTSHEGTLSVTSEADPDHKSFGLLRIHIDAVFVDVRDSKIELHVAGDATIPVMGET